MDTTGKQICEILKSVRKEIALRYGLDYKPTECDYEGDCAGFCEKCDAEIMDLERQLMKKNHADIGMIYAQINKDIDNRYISLKDAINHFQYSNQTLAGIPICKNLKED